MGIHYGRQAHQDRSGLSSARTKLMMIPRLDDTPSTLEVGTTEILTEQKKIGIALGRDVLTRYRLTCDPPRADFFRLER